MKSRNRWRMFWLLLFLTLPITAAITIWRYPLWSVQQLVRFKFDVQHLSAKQLAQKLDRADSNLLIFDVRKAEEYQVSHLKGAILVDPDIDAASFLNQYGAQARDKQLIFYCSAGYRSSQLAERIKNAPSGPAAQQLYNLDGGIFRWYNEGHPVYNQQGSTNAIHPYAERFKGMIDSTRAKQSP